MVPARARITTQIRKVQGRATHALDKAPFAALSGRGAGPHRENWPEVGVPWPAASPVLVVGSIRRTGVFWTEGDEMSGLGFVVMSVEIARVEDPDEYLCAVEDTMHEWNSKEDEIAWRDL